MPPARWARRAFGISLGVRVLPRAGHLRHLSDKKGRRSPSTFSAARVNGREGPSVGRRCPHSMKYVTSRLMGMCDDSCADAPLGERQAEPFERNTARSESPLRVQFTNGHGARDWFSTKACLVRATKILARETGTGSCLPASCGLHAPRPEARPSAAKAPSPVAVESEML
jgi:hypothetical protein